MLRGRRSKPPEGFDEGNKSDLNQICRRTHSSLQSALSRPLSIILHARDLVSHSRRGGALADFFLAAKHIVRVCVRQACWEPHRVRGGGGERASRV